ncbi:DNA/RNA helicase domain-containing protein [Asticcacaulis excentricus]|uniref:DNA/RNA helicase domain-containing protein n=1 Tax=Asticcacaulis excentricus TaxID=78587 RepID=UPI0001A7702A|nr:DNA/RNA helicase domain-containing protein [Asticcacaulis excentricus]
MRAYYTADREKFFSDSDDQILGELARANPFAFDLEQRARGFNGWQHYKFAGTKWRHVNDAYAQLYLKNAYRVILTRVRQGMVVFVPKGDADDPTRPPGFYDAIWQFLIDCGLPALAVSG